LKFNKFPILFY